MEHIDNFWTLAAEELWQQLGTSSLGLSDEEAGNRLRQQRKATGRRRMSSRGVILLLRQYRSPLVLLLVFAAVLSLILKEYSDSLIVLIVLLLTGILGFVQERNAGNAVEKLQALVRNKAMVKRQETVKEIVMDEIVPGDIILLNAGDIIPADSLIMTANDLHINEAALTGESYPAEKTPGICATGTPASRAANAVFKGTNVISGTAEILAVNTGAFTILGKIAASLKQLTEETAFEKGIRRFGFFLMRITIIIALVILILNIFLRKPVVDSMLFALALAVGMTPELLPAIITITLSAGAKRMAAKKVIVKKLNAIQNLGEINILCADKTGTLTEGTMQLSDAVDYAGKPSDKVLLYAYLNAFHETGFYNPIDEAIRIVPALDATVFPKLDEVPYDFIRKRLSIVVSNGDRHIMITKGAVKNILSCCTLAETEQGIVPVNKVITLINEQFTTFSQQGFRSIAVCYKDVSDDPVINKEDENNMIFLGLLTFMDPPKQGIIPVINKLNQSGIKLKLISGDNELVVTYLGEQIGLKTNPVITGRELTVISEEALQQKVMQADIFAEVEPMQKERIIKALQKRGQVVGFLGDGINDASALKSADVGISVDSAADIAKESASVVLLEKDIDVVRAGIMEGRKTFMNTLKYIFVVTSANFGNMFSMAIASLLLPFLPLLATQILLNNFLSDIPSLAIGSDNVDAELIARPRQWDINYIKRFMIIFGLQSSLFDFLTFILLLYFFRATVMEFRTGWFMESLLTQVFTLLIIRTARPTWKSRPGKYLLTAAIGVMLIAILIPYSPFASYFHFLALPAMLLISIWLITILYIIMAETTKRWVMKRL